MLSELHIENIAVIEKADIEFSSGFNVLTGETGAGKSIVIDSIGAILGDRTNKDIVRHGAESGKVTAVFYSDAARAWLRDNDIDVDEEIIIQRKISRDGKNSCRICGTPVTVSQLKELSALLVDIHGQNDGRKLLDEKSHLDYLDAFAKTGDYKKNYISEYKKYCSIKKQISSLKMDDIEKARLSDSLKHQISELETAEIKPGEEELLIERRDLLHNFEKISDNLNNLSAFLYEGENSALSAIDNSIYYATKAAAYADSLSDVSKALNDASFLISNATEIIKDFKASMDFSSEEYDAIESRISQLSRLERKYSRTEEELLVYLDECKEKLDELEYSEDMLLKLEKQLKVQRAACKHSAAELSEKRKIAAAELEKAIVAELRDLNMPSVRFKVEFSAVCDKAEFDSTGADVVRFVMSANKGEELGRISKIASGGELSRIMLAMKNVFSKTDTVETMIFDEIDTGVSGIAAQRVGEKLFQVSRGKQVMCITHLPQIAALADSHYMVAKTEEDGRTYTELTVLNREGREYELARLYGGEVITQLTLQSAAEQLSSASKFKEKL